MNDICLTGMKDVTNILQQKYNHGSMMQKKHYKRTYKTTQTPIPLSTSKHYDNNWMIYVQI